MVHQPLAPVMNYSNILFLDIETVSQYSDYQQLPQTWRELWDQKAGIINRGKEGETSESAYPRASIYAEFGKIVCISCGCIQEGEGERKMVIRSYYGDDEKALLVSFSQLLQKWTAGDKSLCAHNGKEFDYPYICRRMIINGMEIPEPLKIAGRKPWEIRHLDTMELWKFGDYKNYTSLKLLAAVLGVPSPKDDIDGSMVYEVYWKNNDLQRIVTYCQKDVITLAQVYLRYHCQPLIKEENITIKYVQD
jgi:3'-5' exonuclease